MQIQLLFFLVLFFILLSSMTLSSIITDRKHAKTDPEKRFVTLYHITLMITFAAGGLIRVVQQNTRSQWQEGFVGIFMGMYISLWGVPILWRAWHNEHAKYGRIKKIISVLISFLLGISGASLICWGLYEVWISS